MNKTILTVAACLVLAAGAQAQTPPTPPAPKPVVPARLKVRPSELAPILDDAARAMELARPALVEANAELALHAAQLADMDLHLQGLGVELAAMPAMPVMPVMPVMPAMPALAAMDFDLFGGSVRDAERIMEEARASRTLASEAPAPSQQPDAADSVYQAARTALNRSSYQNAARLFRSIRDRYQRSTYVADSYYWEAFSLYSQYRQTQEIDNLRTAVRALDDQKAKYPRATTRGDGDVLVMRALGELARRGDGDAARRVASAADSSRHGAGVGVGVGSGASCAQGEDEDDVRIAALNALQQMNSEDAVPMLRQVLARRDACSAQLRKKAVFIVSQKRSTETEDILLNSARNDPDRDVRSAAVQWLGNVGTEKAMVALDSIILGAGDVELRTRAIQSLAQHRDPRAGDMLRDFVQRADAPDDLREMAVFSLAQNRRSPQNSQFLREYYKRAVSRRLKDRIVSALAQAGGDENAQFLLAVALDEQETVESRKQALFQAGQSRSITFDSLAALYDRIQNREMKEQLIFVYSQRRGPEAVDKLMDIAKKEKDRELRNKAIFWLGQSRDPRAAAFLLQLINQ